MTAKQLAIQDIQRELEAQGKCFIAFRKPLDPIMRSLVRRQIETQHSIYPDNPLRKAHSQLIARCFFCKTTGKVSLDNYSHYYPKYEKKSLF